MEMPVLEITHVTKEFPGVKALDDVSMSIYKGKVHVLIGENGAGKSTLFKTIAGIHKPNSGEIYYNGEKVEFSSPSQAIHAGIAMIHQELSAIDDLSIAENLFLGKEPISKGLFLDRKTMNLEAKKALEKIDVHIDPMTKVRNLKTAEVQMVEIAKALMQNASVIIMDEPTSSLSDHDTEVLFGIIEKLKKKDVAIIYVSHRLKEIYQIGDTITVLRDGVKIVTLPIEETDEDKLISLMVGRDFTNFIRSESHAVDEVILDVQHLSKKDQFEDISFQVHKGEIFGLAGLIGAGRTEVLRSLFGADTYDQGTVSLYNKKVLFKSPQDAIKMKIGLIPEDRRAQGLLVNEDTVRNVALPSLYDQSIGGFINTKWEVDTAKDYVKSLLIKTPTVYVPTKNLSGGNQQKVIIAKWMAANSQILFLDEPTRGIDVNAKAEIYELIHAFTKAGGSVVLVSSELVELLSLCDRIAVMREGKMKGIISHEEASEELIMKYASTDN